MANDNTTDKTKYNNQSSKADGPSSSGSTTGRIIWWVAIAIIVASLFFIFRALPFDQLMSALKDWIAGLGYWGPLAFAVVYVVATICFIPGTILTLAAGALFGLWIGLAVVSVSSTIGAALAFLIARYLARDRVAKMADGNRHFGAIDKAIGDGGWKVVGLLRLSPAIPFNVQNYLYGLTPVKFWPCVLTSWIAMLPGTFLYVYIGHVTGAAVGEQRERSTGEWVMLGVGLLATIAVTVYVTRLAKSKLNKEVDDDEVGADSDPQSHSGEDLKASQKTTDDAVNLFRKHAVLIASAVVIAIAAGGVQFKADVIEQTLSGLFGPPVVEMKEAYSRKPNGPTFDHSQFDAILREHVDEDGWVDYEGLLNKEDELDDYLDTIASAPFDELGRDEKLALLINGYNASTLKLILNHYPLDSIMDIKAEDRWDLKEWEIGGKTYSLNQIEHEQIRPNFKEPRIHFAVVCAAVGCPPLRNEAYDARRIEEQLQDQAEYVHDHATWFQFDADRASLKLTKLYKWYGGDFEQASGSVLNYVAQFSDALQNAVDEEETRAPQWLPYDWTLNSRSNKQSR